MNTKLTDMFLNSFDCEFHIAAFTETWLTNNTHNSEIFCGKYQVFRRDRVGKRGGGVLIAVSCLYPAEEILFENSPDIEIIVVVTQILHISLFITCSYIPPNSDPQLYEKHVLIIKSVADRLKSNDFLIICGDFNIPTTSWITTDDTNFLIPVSANDWTQDFFNSLSDLNVFQINNIPNSNNRLLDLVFVNNPSIFDVSRTNPLFIPEDRHHPTLLISTPLPQKKAVHTISESLCFKRTNYQLLNNLLHNINWLEILVFSHNGSNFDQIVQKFYSILLSCLSASTPLLKKTTSSRPPWYSRTLTWLKNRKNRLYKKFMKSKSPMDQCLYLIAQSRYIFENKKCYTSYINKMKFYFKKSPKMFYNFVNSKRRVSTYPTTMKMNNAVYSNNADIANAFADFFGSTFSTKTFHNTIYPYDIISTTLVNISSLDVNTVLKSMRSLKNSYNPGPDGIPSCILKNCADVLVNPITHLFNSSLKFGIFPNCWKDSFIIPLHKSGSRSDVTNYRAIAKLNSIPKLFEKIITNILTNQISTILSPVQHGFCEGRSTSTNLMELTSFINSGFSNGVQTDVVYTDFSKAFDKVNHDLLLVKLNILGFPVNLLKWISSYLKDRRQRVFYNNCLSKYMKVTSGVPQGSHLGPILFLLFINDLPKAIQYSYILMFADDVKLYSWISNDEDTFHLQTDLNNFFNWCTANLMELNLTKCKTMTFCRYSPVLNAYFLNGSKLNAVNSFLDLGILFDVKLNFNSHVIMTVNKANGVLSFIKRWAKEFNDPYVTKNLFTALVRPLLEYGSVIWDPQYDVYIQKLESVQKQFLLFCLRSLHWNTNINLPSYRSRLTLIRLPTLKSRRIIANIAFVLNLIQGKIDSTYLHRKLSINVPNRQLRYYEPLYIQFNRSNYLNFDPFRRICAEVNKFYVHIDFSENVAVTRRKLIMFLNSNAYV